MPTTLVPSPPCITLPSGSIALPKLPDDPATVKTASRIGEGEYEFKWLRVSDLLVDSEHYQRVPKDGVVAAIARRIDPILLGNPLINIRPESGDAYVIDGQHRIKGLLKAGWGGHFVLCRVVWFADSQTEAFYYAQFNSLTTPLRNVERVKARIHYGESTAVAIRDILSKYKVVLRLGYGRPDRMTTEATSAMEAVIAEGGVDRLDSVIRIISEVFAEERNAFSYRMVKALHIFLDRYGHHPKYREEQLVTRLREIAYEALLRQASREALKDMTKSGNPHSPNAIAMAILTQYNRELKTRKLPPWTPRWDKKGNDTA